jgi:CHAT domain-containing protein
MDHLRLGALEASDLSLDEIKKYYTSAVCLTKKRATRQQFIATFSLYKIVQLYTHADNLGNEPVLYLADSAIYLSEIQNLSNVNTDLIVLSACNTGIGKNARGEGVFSLARGFASIGIPSMLTTLWKIEDRATYEITELFYKHLSKEVPKDIALQQAKLAYLRYNGKNDNLPYFWAATILLGNTSSFPAEKQKNNNLYYIGVFASIIGCSLLVKKYFSGKNKSLGN